VLPQLWLALALELLRWHTQGDWNSRLRSGQTWSGPEMALHLTSARCFGTGAKGVPPPRGLLDATGDEELLALLFEMEVAMVRAEDDPPPNTRYIAVRTGMRFGKTSLTARHGRDLARAIAECR